MSILDKKIGIIGGGQLGKMMILEAKRMDPYIITLDPTEDCPSSSISNEIIVGGLKDKNKILELASKLNYETDVITYEIEHIDTETLECLEDVDYKIFPSVKSLKVIQNKYTQKQTLKEKSLLVPDFELVELIEDLEEIGKKFGYPMMLKAAKGGYDGRGNYLIKNEDDIDSAFHALDGENQLLMVEKFVDFAMEISVIATKGQDGEKVFYPVAENIHVDSQLDTTIVPARIDETVKEQAISLANDVMEVFDGVGTFCTEMFVGKDGQVYINEVAPRPHNSGHYTIDGCMSNQFENHVRAICGYPLGNTDLIKPIVMVNLLGIGETGPAELIGHEEALATIPGLKVHVYGKKESKGKRKMGHFTVTANTVEQALTLAEEARKIIRIQNQNYHLKLVK